MKAVLAVAGGLAVALTACGASGERSDAIRHCRTDGSASLCLQTDGGADFQVTGTGFRPGSDVRLDIEGGAGRLVPVDGLGRFPVDGALVGFLPGPDPEVHRLEGVDGAGRPVTFVVTCAVSRANQLSCTF